ncbi:MAG: hypothetical protein H7320_01215 [Ferruginibacter sp.]|nr:hypothetical protein [Ferruginibacter sp.]
MQNKSNTLREDCKYPPVPGSNACLMDDCRAKGTTAPCPPLISPSDSWSHITAAMIPFMKTSLLGR